MDDLYRFDIIDFGSQYTHLISKKLRRAGVFSLIYHLNDYTLTEKTLGIFFSGGPMDIEELSVQDSFKIMTICHEAKVKGLMIIGICFGAQILTLLNNGRVVNQKNSHYGGVDCHLVLSDLILENGTGKCNEECNGECNKFINKELANDIDILTNNINFPSKVWMSHTNSILLENQKASNYNFLYTNDKDLLGFYSNDKNQLGLLFHPEVEHTEYSDEWFTNITKLSIEKWKNSVLNENSELKSAINCYSWSSSEIYKKILKDYNFLKGKNVLIATSGGVDSTLTIYILKEIGANVTGILVNHGFLRKNEENEVRSIFRLLNMEDSIRIIDAKTEFLSALQNISSSEDKRKIIGRKFIEVFVNYIKKNNLSFNYFAQGTIYPDIIESGGTKGSKVIKAHHNVGGLATELLKENNLTLIEPLKYLYKDDIRALGKFLNLRENIIMRQPFPGPGLAIRIIGIITEDRLERLQEADYIVCQFLNSKYSIWQLVVILIPEITTGVVGDRGILGDVIVIRAVNSVDGMTATPVLIKSEDLIELSSIVTNKITGVVRLVYDYTGKPPGTIEWQ